MTPYYEHAGIELFLGDCREILPALPPASFDGYAENETQKPEEE